MSLARRLALAVLAFAGFAIAAAPTTVQRIFPTPAAAAQSLLDAVRANDRAATAAVLGPGSAGLVDSGDPVEDAVARLRFVSAAEDSMRIRVLDGHRALVVIGPEQWVVPFPLVRTAGGWRFDTRSGRGEVLARRIGRNELAAMQAALAFVDAQREYALAKHDGVGPGVYARRIASTRGRHDGLYWTPSREDPLSPLGVMFTFAAAEEAPGTEARPYHGYYFRILEAQGEHAPGGTAEYVVGDRMIGGFALVAWPVRYRVSGVRTFIVSHDGVVYSSDLGPRTAALARAMRRFDPAPGWRQEAAIPTPSNQGDRMRHLAGELACTMCHREAPAARASDGAMPLAPAWAEIAARYRSRDDAEEQLTRVVIEGADPGDRHWKERLEFTKMGGNAPRVSPDEARALVRWILSAS
ncbi:MAG TPA: DUF2950 family protein [Usitatibacter sp.]|nr:DUF2950 family protein [Usitatibacter sp.]